MHIDIYIHLCIYTFTHMHIYIYVYGHPPKKYPEHDNSVNTDVLREIFPISDSDIILRYCWNKSHPAKGGLKTPAFSAK